MAQTRSAAWNRCKRWLQDTVSCNYVSESAIPELQFDLNDRIFWNIQSIYISNIYKSNLSKLQVMQNKAARKIAVSNPRSNIDAMFKESGLLNLKDINVSLVGKFMYNVYHEKAPDVFEGFLVYNYQVHEHNTRTSFNLHVPPNDSNLCQTGIRYQGVIIWNQVLTKLNIDSSEESLKKCLRRAFSLN